MIEKQTGRTIKCIQSDNAKEYCSKEFDEFLNNEGIKRQLTIPHTPQQNGTADSIKICCGNIYLMNFHVELC